MTEDNKVNGGKLALITLEGLEFENDFGQSPIGLGHFSKDQGFIAVASLVGFFIGCAVTGNVLAGVLVIVAGLNDIGYAKRKGEPPTPDPNVEEPAIDVEARAVDDNPKQIGPTTKLLAVEVEAQEVSVSNDSEVSPPPAATEEPLPQRFVKPQTRDELIEALERECPALLDLVESHPLRVVGVQRSGKTTLVKVLALLRMVLIPGHNVIASTPHYEPGNEYPNVFRVVGLTPNHKRDYPAIQREWNALASRIYESVRGNTTTVWDEFGVYGDILEEDELNSVLTSSLRETKKFGEYPIFIVHGETEAFLPGVKGLVGNFLRSTVRVETIGEKVKGDNGLKRIRPTGKFTVKDVDKTQASGRIPEWLTEEFLLQLLGSNPTTRQPQPSFVSVKELAEETPTANDNVPVTELKVSDCLGEPLKTIWLFAKEKKEWVTSKEIYQKSYAVLKGKGVKEIRQYLGLLADTGYGEIDEQSKSDSAVAFRAY